MNNYLKTLIQEIDGVPVFTLSEIRNNVVVVGLLVPQKLFLIDSALLLMEKLMLFCHQRI
jgi:hypothetical protein